MLPVACRDTFPAAVVTLVHASLREPILKLIELSTGGSLQRVLLMLVGRGWKPTAVLQVTSLLDAVSAFTAV